MYIPFSYFGGNTCLYYIAINEDAFGNYNAFNYTDCNDVTQSVLMPNYTAQYFSVNATQPTSLGGFGSEIKNTTINSPINNLPRLNNYYQIVTSKAAGLFEQLQATLFVPWYSSSFGFDYFSINTADSIVGQNSQTYITSYPQFVSVAAADYTIFPIEDTSYLTTTIDYLIVAGGGGGGNDTGTGGGGAGGLISGSLIVSASGYPTLAYVGNGGNVAQNGSNSTLFGLTAIGGGRGNQPFDTTGSNGGSGGGSGTSVRSSGSIGQGYGGGSGSQREAGGGGGASQRGADGSGGGEGGNGGSGSQWLDGVWYAGGGGGGADRTSAASSLGGIGGGGRGGVYTSITSSAGQPNTGGGGGGGGLPLNNGGSAGGSGIVKLRYPGPKRATGGNYTYYNNGYTYHVYTTTGVSSSFEFFGGKYPNLNYNIVPTSSLAVTSSLVCLIDSQYTESFVDFKNQLIYDSTPYSTNVFNQLSSAYSYVTSSTFPYIEYNGRPSSTFDSTILRFNNIASLTPINNITLVAVYNIPKFTSTTNDSGKFIPVLGDERAQRSTATNDSQLDQFGIFVTGSQTGVYGVNLRHHNDSILLPYSSSINGWHITQMSYNGSTDTITWANDNITGSNAISNDNWYRFTLAVQKGQNLSVPNYFETGSKFKLFAVYTSSLSSTELIENYNFISQSLI